MDKQTKIFTLAGAGLAAALLAGCLGTSQDSGSDSQATQAALLALAVKDSGSCKVLHERCKAARSDGEVAGGLIDSLVIDCIVDTAAAHRILEGGGKGRGGPGHGGRHGGPKLDSTARAALCDSLKSELAATDSSSVEYPHLSHMTHRVCEDRRPHDVRGHGRGPGPGHHRRR